MDTLAVVVAVTVDGAVVVAALFWLEIYPLVRNGWLKVVTKELSAVSCFWFILRSCSSFPALGVVFYHFSNVFHCHFNNIDRRVCDLLVLVGIVADGGAIVASVVSPV